MQPPHSSQGNRFRLLLSGLGCLVMLTTCQVSRPLTHPRTYRISAITLTGADLVGGTEIDTGRFVLLAHELSSSVRHVSDSWYVNALFVKLKTLDDLPIGKTVVIPSPAVSVSAYSRSTWYFENIQHLTGTITRLDASPSGQRIKLKLHYTNRKGGSQTWLNKTVLFRDAPDYFKQHEVDYKGKYDDLRLALKEPAKVKSLDLITYAIQYEKRNGRDSGPDTLYRRLGELHNLEELNLNLSGLTVLPASFSKLKRLKKLDLGYNHLTSFPSILLGLDSLQELNLEWNRLDSIPTSVTKFKQLQVLNLDNNRLNRFPLAVIGVTGLQELGVSNANLRVLPNQLRQLTNLQVLRLDGFWNNKRRNQLQDVSSLSNLKSLRSLSLKENQLLSAPVGLYQLQGLEELYLQSNGLDSTKIETRRFPKLRKLVF